MPADAAELRAELVHKLVTAGALADPRWINAFSIVPRHPFTPAFWHRTPDGLHWVSADLLDQQQRWLDLTYRDIPLITQLDDDGTATCASSQPSMMARMLEALDVSDGHTVLEVGTGTGYNAALLSYRLGDDLVTTVEYDPGLSLTAVTACAETGFRPTAVVGDGTAGCPDQAPYDRIIATYGVRRVPSPWIEQARPGAVIVVNIGYGLVALRIQPDGESAGGRFLPVGAGFMWSRAGTAALSPFEVLRLTRGDGEHAEAHAMTYDDEGFIAWLRLFAPDLTQTVRCVPGEPPEYLFASGPHDWARVCGGTATYRGTAWEAVSRAQRTWVEAGQPNWDRLGLTVTPDGQHTLWMDEPVGSRRWALQGRG